MPHTKQFHVYIMTNVTHSVLYTGVTSNLAHRIHQHRQKLLPGFTSKYNVCKLVYFEVHSNPADAIYREKQIKAGPRRKKLELIEGMNPFWRDLVDDLFEV